MSGEKRRKLPSARAEKAVRPFLKEAVLKIIEMLDDGTEIPGMMCANCGEKTAKFAYGVMVYENPWAVKPVWKHTCGAKCFEEYFYADEFQCFFCPACGRNIISHSSIHPLKEYYVEREGLKICLKCIEEAEECEEDGL